MVDRERIIAAHDAWRDAETAYSDEVAKYVAAWWMEAGPPPTMPEPVTREALDKLNRLRKVADDTRTAYFDILGEGWPAVPSR